MPLHPARQQTMYDPPLCPPPTFLTISSYHHAPLPRMSNPTKWTPQADYALLLAIIDCNSGPIDWPSVSSRYNGGETSSTAIRRRFNGLRQKYSGPVSAPIGRVDQRPQGMRRLYNSGGNNSSGNSSGYNTPSKGGYSKPGYVEYQADDEEEEEQKYYPPLGQQYGRQDDINCGPIQPQGGQRTQYGRIMSHIKEEDDGSLSMRGGPRVKIEPGEPSLRRVDHGRFERYSEANFAGFGGFHYNNEELKSGKVVILLDDDE